MEAKAYLRYVRISPRKVQIVCDLIRGKDINTANAENNFSMDTSKLYVSEVYATSGPILKRMIPASKGRGYRINKRTSHVTLAVAERD